MKPPRGLSEEESAAWAKLAATVDPLRPLPPRKTRAHPVPVQPVMPKASPAPPLKKKPGEDARPSKPVPNAPPRPSPRGGGTLDSHWDRRLKAGDIAPDVSLDLHGHGLDRAYTRLMDGMAQARSMGARVVLIVTGKPRPVDPADRGSKRGAIRAKILDWLAASEHGASIAAVRKAHQRHGGDGALYIVLRKGG